MAHYDCLLIGHNELDFQQYYNILDNMASSGGRDHVAFIDMHLNCVEHKGRPYQAEEILTHFYNEGKPEEEKKVFYNGDCFWTAIAYLGSYLTQRGYTIDYVNLFHLEKDLLKKKLQENEYTTIALTGTMYVFEQNIYEAVSFIRKQKKNATIVAGGPYISKQAEEREPEYLRPLFRYLNADIYCYVREGEQTLTKIIDALKSGADLSTVKNIAYKKGREFVITPKERETNPLSDNIINYSLFRNEYAKTGWANVRVSDGCPYACGFCAFPEHNNERYELMSMDRIEREFNAIRDAETISHIFFIDATLNVPRPHFKEMMRMMIRNKYPFKWHCFFRCDQTDEETIDLMAQAGCIGVFLGLESASEPVLRNMDKGAHKKDFRRTMPWFKRAGIRQMLSMLVGFPGETYATFRETLDFLEEINPDFTRPQIWFCDPTTPVWRRREEFNLHGKAYGWSHYTMDAETAVELVVETFFSLKGPTWIPDPGFNWTFLYAMEKNGMSIEQQKTFLKFFSAAAKEKFLKPNRKEMAPELLHNFKISAQFDRGLTPDISVLDQYAPERYIAAESFWIDRFRQSVARGHSSLTDSGLNGEVIPLDNDTESAVVTKTLPELAVSSSDGSLVNSMLASYSIGLASLDGREDAPILLSLDDGDPFPLPLAAESEISFEQLVQSTRNQVSQAEEHRRYALFLLTNAARMKERGTVCPALRFAFVSMNDAEDAGEVLKTRLDHRAHLCENLDIVLGWVSPSPTNQGYFQLSSPAKRFNQESLEQFGDQLMSILAASAAEDAVGVATLRRLIGVPDQYESITLEPIVPISIPNELESHSKRRELPILEAQYAL
jgi:anaerobic magnesium-protoporphyrin IX monomethyl ester cyclase